jgi:hypothetical protein
MTQSLDRFYDLIGLLAALPGQGKPLREYTGRQPWPERGVYFFLEPGESRTDRSASRVVRVGTHAIAKGAKSRLWGRLRAHRGSIDGRGNHRGSIFRSHVGAALLRRDGALLHTWGVGQSAARSVRDGEIDHEKRVSAHIGSMPITWVAVPDPPGPHSARALIERNSIALISNRLDPIDTPGEDWLGSNSERAEIKRSGLWNLNHVTDHCDGTFLDLFAELVEDMDTGGT